jgi:hypothetical protein
MGEEGEEGARMLVRWIMDAKIQLEVLMCY